MERMEMEDAMLKSKDYLPNVSVDNVIFGYHDKELKVLLQKPFYLDKWTVTGGYIKKTESIEEAANRVAFKRTGLNGLFLQQFRSFGNPTRTKDNTFTPKHLAEFTGVEVADEQRWIYDYFVSLGFYTLTEFSTVEIKKGPFDKDCQWWPVSELPRLMFDHEVIILEALKELRQHIAHYPIGYKLLPEKFTYPEIRSLYETILGKQLDERNFIKRLTANGILIRLNEKRSIGAHRSPFLYKFDKERYEDGLKNGIVLTF